MPENYMLIDGNSLGHYYNNSGRLAIGDIEVQAIYGLLRGVRQQIANRQNYTPIVLWDGASWRKLKFAAYKENRDRKETKNEIRLAKMKDSYKKQVPYIKKALRFLGIPQVSAVNMEADDLGAILTDRYTKTGGRVLLMTGDKDWLQLVGPNVIWHDFINSRVVTRDKFQEFTGVETARQFVEVKALCGDAGDNVPGVGGIGEKGAIEFVQKYGSVANFTNQVILEKTIALKDVPKKYRRLVEDEDKAITFGRNLDLVDLRTTARPAPLGLKVDKGTPSREAFERFCELLLFKSITKDIDDWLSVFPHFRKPAEIAA